VGNKRDLEAKWVIAVEQAQLKRQKVGEVGYVEMAELNDAVM